MEMRDKLIGAAARVFAETGYRGATTRRIAQEAGVNEVTLFRHFGSKGELILEALHHFGETVPGCELPPEPGDPRRELTDWARRHLQHLTNVRALIRAAIGESEEHQELAACGSEHPRRVGRQLNEYLVRLKDRGLATRDFDVGVASAMLMGTLFSDALGRDLMPEVYRLSQDDAATAYVSLFLNAIGVQQGNSESAGQSI
ncbi:MAG TPA: helix-turn-helix domain-containing protein [Longimicrobiales bacterium]